MNSLPCSGTAKPTSRKAAVAASALSVSNCCDRAKFPQNFTPAELTIFSSGVNAATRLHLE
jgi:hypothetical protein